MRRALDLFCGAGGASRGLADAGFEVTGVDIDPQPNYPFEFIQADALLAAPELLPLTAAAGGGFDLVWASPPCQAFTAYKRRPGHVRPRPNLIPDTREILELFGVPFIIENIPGARAHLRNPVMLCGSMFGLDVRRHRLFECSFDVEQPECDHANQTPRFPQATNRTNLRSTVEIGVWRIPLDVQQRAMGIDWMTRKELSQAIPPVYACHLARTFMASSDRYS